MKKFVLISAVSLSIVSCVSKKKFIELEGQHQQTVSSLQKTRIEKEELENKFAKIKARAAKYNRKINSLTAENDNKLDIIEGKLILSEANKQKMRTALATMDTGELQNAKTLTDSVNIAVSNNLMKSVETNDLENSDDIDINIDETVVMISISDKMLFRSGSHTVNSKANKILAKLAEVINSEPSVEVLIEGHTDSRTISTVGIQDNWDLSVKRATSIVRLLQNKHNVDPAKLIAAGRSSYVPLMDNSTPENRSRNRSTKISILPKIDKFFALLAAE